MAKRASFTLDSIASTKPGSPPASTEARPFDGGEGATRRYAPGNKRGDVRGYNFRMRPADLVVLKQAALNRDMSLRDIFAAALSDWLARNENVPHVFEPVTAEKKEAE